MNSLLINGKNVFYEVIVKNNKNTYMRIKNGVIVIYTNCLATKPQIEKLIIDNFSKLKKYIDSKIILNRSYQLGDTIKYMGNDYYLRVENGKDFVYVNDQEIVVMKGKKTVDELIDIFYKDATTKLINYLKPGIDKVFNTYELYAGNIRVRKMKSRWGSCNTKTHDICINSLLAAVEPIFLEYVLYHEYTHLKVANHSKKFYEFFDLLFKNRKLIELEMKKYTL